MIPKLILMDKNIDEKIIDDYIVISIYYEERDYDSAILFKNAISKKYKDNIGKYKFKCVLRLYSDIKYRKASATYLLHSSTKNMSRIIDFANDNSIMTLTLSVDDLRKDALISIDINKKVTPVLNFQVLKKSNILLRDILLRIARRY